MFHCLPTKNDEWPKLKQFVRKYIEDNGLEFKEAREVDKNDSTRAYPEVEILFTDGTGMVIEHKNIFWPESYPKRHRVGHQFGERILSALREHFPKRNLSVFIFKGRDRKHLAPRYK